MTTEARPAASGDEPTVTVSAPTVPPTVRRTRRRRRPSGAPPPLPRSIGLTGKGWLIVLGVLLVVVIVALESRGVKRVTDRIDAGLLRAIASVRTGWLTAIMRAINLVGSGWAVTAIAGLLVLALFVFKRWRHLFTFVGSFIVPRCRREAYTVRPAPALHVTVLDVGCFSLPSRRSSS